MLEYRENLLGGVNKSVRYCVLQVLAKWQFFGASMAICNSQKYGIT